MKIKETIKTKWAYNRFGKITMVALQQTEDDNYLVNGFHVYNTLYEAEYAFKNDYKEI